MAWDINRVTIIGRLAADVELKTTPSGAHVANFRVAVGGAKSADGKESVSFFTVVAWNKTAEVCEKYLSKGKQVAVDGRLDQRSWTAQDGSKRSVVEIIAERVEFLGSAGGSGGGSGQDSGARSSYQKPAQSEGGDFEDTYYDNTGYDQPPIDYKSLNDDDMPFKNMGNGNDDIPY